MISHLLTFTVFCSREQKAVPFIELELFYHCFYCHMTVFYLLGWFAVGSWRRVCACLCKGVCACECVCSYLGRAEVNLKCPPQEPSKLGFEIKSPTGAWCLSIRLNWLSPWLQALCVSLPSRPWGHKHVPPGLAFYVGGGNQTQVLMLA